MDHCNDNCNRLMQSYNGIWKFDFIEWPYRKSSNLEEFWKWIPQIATERDTPWNFTF